MISRDSPGMEADGPAKAPGTPSPADLILQQKKDAVQALPQPSGDGGIFSQLSNNPFFTAVWICFFFQSYDRKLIALACFRDLV